MPHVLPSPDVWQKAENMPINTTRAVKSIPERSSAQTWEAIVELLARGDAGRKQELLSVTGIVASLIADKSLKEAAAKVTCDGSCVRVYCLYDEDGADDSRVNESPFDFDPLKGEWSVSLPCHEDDLNWVQNALARYSSRITVRNRDNDVKIVDEISTSERKNLVFNPKGFLKS